VDTPEEHSAPTDESSVDPGNGIYLNGAPPLQTAEDDDGFTQARAGRGMRARGPRGAERGGFRGSFRGNGDFRGSDRGLRGGYRGGFRGGDRGGKPLTSFVMMMLIFFITPGFRGRPNGEWRDGDSRGRGGRGRARGDSGGK
jgi:hypothetical protein